MVLYRTYRPQKFADLIGQEAIAQNLLAQFESGKFGHAYLFYGPKGTGKTSTARIFAKALNCQGLASGGLRSSAKNKKSYTLNTKKLNPKFGEPCGKCQSCLSITEGSYLDLIEIDAASNRGIDEIRELREKIKLSPIAGRFKVYIIDEAHMLTTEAFNALLKTLEEPPAHAIFILCTTEFGKLPATIVSRLQKFHFARAGTSDLIKVIEKIAKSENIKIDSDALSAIAEVADGSYRDAVSIFDQLSSNKKIQIGDVAKIVKTGGWNQLYTFSQDLADKKLKEAVLTIEKISSEGADVSYFAKQAILFLEKLLFIKIGILDDALGDYSRDQIEKMRKLSEEFSSLNLQNLIRLFLVAEGEIKLYPLPQIPLVLAVCKYMPQEESEIKKSQIVEVSSVLAETKAAKELKKSAEVRVAPKVLEKSKELVSLKQVVAAKSKSKSMQPVVANWEKFLGKVKSMNVHIVALLRSSRPVDFDGVNLTMEVFYRFHKEKLEEPKIVRMLDSVMEEVISKPVKLRFILADKDKSPPPRVVERSNVVDISKQDIAKMAQEIFSK